MILKQWLSITSVLIVGLCQASLAVAITEFEEDQSLPVVYLNIVIEAGAAHDPAEKLGLANVASQMLLRGTHKRDKNEFFAQIDRLGGRLDVEVNSEGTIYRAAVLSENLERFLELVTETFTRPKFTSTELTKVKNEVEGEILELKSDDRSLAQYHFQRFFYGAHPYGNPASGTRKGVRSVDYKDVVDFYANHFGGKALHLFGSGAAKESVVAQWFETLTEKLTAIHPEAKPGAGIPKPQIPPQRRALLVSTPKSTQSQVLLGGVGMRPDDPGFYAAQLANHSFGGGSFQARMMQELRVKRGWTYGARNSFRYGRERRNFAMWFFPQTENTVPAIKLTLGLFDDFVKKGITREEYKFAKESLVNNAPFNYDTSKKRLENRTTEFLTKFPEDFFKDFAKNISKVDFDEIVPALDRLFDPSSLTLVVVGNSAALKQPISKLPGFANPQVKDYMQD